MIMASCTIVPLLAVVMCFPGNMGLTVTTPVGDIEGFVNTIDIHGRNETVRKFFGIPYAEPATGIRRFAKPVPRARFTAPFKALNHGTRCYQKYAPKYAMSEDCLVLDIYSPERLTGSETYPVMIWIHGGSFVMGSTTWYNGDYFSLDGQVILVVINYRLAELGFFSTMDSDMPGNYGLWDQQLAIKWVHANIAAFGGDTNRVTVFGESAGSVSVMFQALYPGNQGLFQRIIAQSGSATSSWARLQPTDVKEGADKFTKAIGCSRQASADTLQCLRSKSADEMNATMNGDSSVPYIWAPVLDNDFIVDFPHKILDGTSKFSTAVDMFKSVDIVIGTTNYEGAVNVNYWLGLINKTHSQEKTITKAEFENFFIPHYLKEYYKVQTPEVVSEITRLAYTDWSDPNDDTKRLIKLIDLDTDLVFKIPSIDVADGHTKLSSRSTYVFEFCVRRYPSHSGTVPASIDGPGVAGHGDDTGFLFRAPDAELAAKVGDVNSTAVMLRVSTAMINMWTNFAKTGDPNKPVDVTGITNGIWPQYGAEENYMKIEPVMTSQSVRQRLVPEAFDLFKKVVPELINATTCQPCTSPGVTGILVG